jgi:hypothetical protein
MPTLIDAWRWEDGGGVMYPYMYIDPSRSFFLPMFIKGPSPTQPPQNIFFLKIKHHMHTLNSRLPPRIIIIKLPPPNTHTQTSTPQAGAAGLKDLHWADGKALIHQAIECSASEEEEEAWAALLEWLVASPAVDVNARVGGVLMAG